MLSSARTLAERFLRDQKGLETVEYAIVTGLIVAGLIVTITAIGSWVVFNLEQLLVSASLSGAGG